MRAFLMLLLAAMITSVSCGPQKPSPETYQRQWMLKSFRNYEFDYFVKNRAQLDLAVTKSNEKQYRAYMGCNQMFLKADFKANGKVTFSDVGSTMMYCEGLMKLEDDFAKTLPAMNKYVINGHQLTLSDGKGTEMKFVAADWD